MSIFGKIKNHVKVLLWRLYHLSCAKVVSRLRRKPQMDPYEAATKHITISTSEVLFQHNSQKDFQRYDMIVRLLAVENYYNLNDYGFAFYERMQRARKGADWPVKAIPLFRKLIESYKQNGYDESSEIELDSELHLIDGSHRMAMAMYHGCKTIRAKVRPEVHPVFYGIEWFRINGFTEDECRILQEKAKEIKRLRQVSFVCTLWHPVHGYFDEITEHLRLFGEVVEVKDVGLSEFDYRFMTHGIYAVDDIEKWKINKKIDYMLSQKSDKYYMRMVAINLADPDFRLKANTNGTLSKKCELIKSLIRSAYKDKVENYFHDIIMHIGDNFYQNEHIYSLFHLHPIDVSKALDSIRTCNYVIIKFDVNYMPPDFPIHYPMGKDIDIVSCDDINYSNIVQRLTAFVEPYKELYDIRVVKKESGTQFRIEKNGYLIFLFDVIRNIPTMADGIQKEMCLLKTEIKNFHIPTTEFEILFRLDEYHNNPQKAHHLAFVLEHKNEINNSLCDKYLMFDWNQYMQKSNA